ncbi:IclR family transcriptional regulator [Rhodococcus koreensis]
MTQVLDEIPTSTLHRASLILDALRGSDTLNLTQIVARTGLPRSSVHRTLDRLVALRWAARRGSEYSLGMQILELGSIAMHMNPMRQAALPSLYQLHRSTGCIVHLGILEGTDVVYLEKIGGHLDTAVPSRIGGRLPAHLSAIGKSLLAAHGIGGGIAGSRQVRHDRLSYESEQSVPGYGCVAAPIGPPRSRTAVAAVSICGPIERIASDPLLRLPVQRAAAQIWRELVRSGDGASGNSRVE